MKKFPRVIAGAGGGGGKGGGGGNPHQATESPDSLRSKAFVRLIDLLSEGEIDGLANGLQSIMLDDTPVQNPDGSLNFQNFSLIAKSGMQSQTSIPGFPASESTTTLSSEVVAATPITHTITNPAVDYALVTIGVPLLTTQDASNGDITGGTVQFAIDLQTNGGGFVPQTLQADYVGVGTAGNTGTVGATTVIRGQFVVGLVGTDPELSSYGSGEFIGRLEYQSTSGGAWNVAQTWEQFVFSFLNQNFISFYITGLPLDSYNVRIITVPSFFPVGDAVFTSLQYVTGVQYATISGKTTSRYQRSFRIPLAGGGPWDIRVRRLTPDSVTQIVQNRTFFDAITEGVSSRFAYPNSALMGLVVDAEQFKSVPRRGYVIKGLKVKIPSNYNPTTRVYTGVWDGTFTVAWTNNPAWCWYDMVTNTRYGLGKYVDATLIDKWALYTISQYCDGLVSDGQGGTEPRFTCNLYLQTQDDAMIVIQTMASIFRGMAYWGGGLLVPTQDAPGSAVNLFTNANVRDGLFTYAGSAKNQRHTVALVTWNDPANHYRQKVEYVPDRAGIARYGVVETQLVAVGCTSRGQAHRVGKWLLFTERLETDTVIFQTALEGYSVRPGDLFKVADQDRAGKRMGGRLIAATTTALTLDNPLIVEVGKTYSVDVKLADGSVQTRSITNTPGTYTVINLNTALPSAPQVMANFVITVNDLVPQLFRCVSAVVKDDTWIEVLGLQNVSGKYAAVESDVQFDPLPVTTLQAVPGAPSNIQLTDFIRILDSGDIQTVLSVSWTPPANSGLSLRYLVEYRKPENNWAPAPGGDVTANHIDISGVSDGNLYDVRITAVNALGIRSPTSVQGTWLVAGKLVPPTDVPSFSAVQQGNLVLFVVGHVPDPDLDSIELRFGELDNDWDNASTIGNILRGQEMTTASIPPGTWKFFAKAKDTSGNYSINALEVILTVTNTFTLIASQNFDPDWQFDDYAVEGGDGTVSGVPLVGASVSVAAWVNLAAFRNFTNVVVNHWTNDGWILYVPATGIPAFGVAKAGVPSLAVGNASLTVAKWARLVGTYDGATVKLYVDSVLQTTAPAVAGAAGDTAFALNVFSAMTAGEKSDRVRVWNRALTADEIAADFVGDEAWPGMVGGWNFDEGASPSLDISGNGHSVALTGTWVSGRLWNKFYGTVKCWNGMLTLESQSLASALGEELWDEFVPNAYPMGYYESAIIDKVQEAPARIWGDVISVLGPGELGFANTRFTVDFRTALGHFAGFQDWSIGTANFEYLKARLNMDAGIGKVVVSAFKVNIDNIETILHAENVAVSAGGTAITFMPPFHRNPNLQVTPRGGTAVVAGFTGLTINGATLRTFDSTTGLPTAAAVDWTARGV